jgi:hypothetical protein
MSSELPLKADIAQNNLHVSKVPTTEVAFSLDHLVGEREVLPDEAERRFLGSPPGLASGWFRD